MCIPHGDPPRLLHSNSTTPSLVCRTFVPLVLKLCLITLNSLDTKHPFLQRESDSSRQSCWTLWYDPDLTCKHILKGVSNVIEDRKKEDYRKLRQPLCAQQNKKTLEG